MPTTGIWSYASWDAFVLFYTSRVVCKGRLTMEEIIFSLKHYWRFVDSEALELKALSQGVAEKAA